MEKAAYEKNSCWWKMSVTEEIVDRHDRQEFRPKLLLKTCNSLLFKLLLCTHKSILKFWRAFAMSVKIILNV